MIRLKNLLQGGESFFERDWSYFVKINAKYDLPPKESDKTCSNGQPRMFAVLE